MSEIPPPPHGANWSDWGERLNAFLQRNLYKLNFIRGGESAADDGYLAWDRSELHPVVSRSGKYQPLAYGNNAHLMAYTTETHSADSADTAYAITWENSAYEAYMTIDDDNDSRIVFEKDGLYQVDFSAELQSQNFFFKTIYIWPRINGVDIPFSTMVHSLRNANESAVVTRSAIFRVEAGDYLEAMFAVDNTNLWIEGTGATSFSPASPSATIAVCQVDV